MLIFTGHPDSRPVFINPKLVAAIMVAIETPGPGMIGKPVGSLIIVAGASIVVREEPEDAARAIARANAPVFTIDADTLPRAN